MRHSLAIFGGFVYDSEENIPFRFSHASLHKRLDCPIAGFFMLRKSVPSREEPKRKPELCVFANDKIVSNVFFIKRFSRSVLVAWRPMPRSGTSSPSDPWPGSGTISSPSNPRPGSGTKNPAGQQPMVFGFRIVRDPGAAGIFICRWTVGFSGVIFQRSLIFRIVSKFMFLIIFKTGELNPVLLLCRPSIFNRGVYLQDQKIRLHILQPSWQPYFDLHYRSLRVLQQIFI